MNRGMLVILSGPSGVGKSSLIDVLLKDDRFELSVSATTRNARPGEVDGDDYFFLDEAEFRRRISEGHFLEWAEVHGSALYGTLASEVERIVTEGHIVLLDIDVQGAELIGDRANMSVFIAPPSFDDLEQRLRNRGSEDAARIARRLETARTELERINEFDHVVVNDDLNRAAAELRELCDKALATKE